jgi:hypothetical protein
MTKTQIYIPTDILQKAKIKAKAIGKKNLSQYIREILELDLDKPSAVKKPKISVVKISDRKIKNYSQKTNQIYDYKL